MEKTFGQEPLPKPKTSPEVPPIEINPGEIHVRPEVDFGEEPLGPLEPIPERPYEPAPVPEREQPSIPEIEPGS